MNWEDIPDQVKRDMEFLGNFGPIKGNSKIKGWMADDVEPGVTKVYLDSKDLIELAQSCRYVADWLDENQITEYKPKEV